MPRVESPPAKAVAQLAQSSNAFGFDLYRRLRAQPGNLVVSPASITTALAMTWGGARGETAAEMRKVLHLDGTPDEVMAASGQLARSLQDPARPLVFHIANQLFGEQSYTLEPVYLRAVKDAFGAPVELVDFKKAPEKARVQVNEWVEKKTEKRIQDLVPPGAFDDQTRLVLVNAIYFLGKWMQPFEPAETNPADFHLSATEAKKVPTMNQTSSFRTAWKDGVSAIELPYRGGMSMLVLVPGEIEGLAALEAALDGRQLDAIVGGLQREYVRVSIPKLEVNPDRSLALGELLKSLGMPLAFDRFQADFTAIANPPEPADRLVIGEVFHKGFVKVDEEGTEAAAATAVVGVRGGGGPPPPPRLFKVDRPFLFLIRDNASGLVLFLGRLGDPSRV